MKPKILILLLVLFGVFSCTNQSKVPLTQEEKSIITNEIMAVSDQWIEDNKNMDADAAIRFWSTSAELRFAENGEFFANRDSIQSTLHNYYAQTTSMNVKWLERDVRVLTQSIALMAGKFQFDIGFGMKVIGKGQMLSQVYL